MAYHKAPSIGPTELVSRQGYMGVGAIGPTELVSRPGYMSTGATTAPRYYFAGKNQCYDKKEGKLVDVKLCEGALEKEWDKGFWSRFGQGIVAALTPAQQQQTPGPQTYQRSASPGIGPMPSWMIPVGLAVAGVGIYFLVKGKNNG
jgi:hypothetical protein